MVVIKCGRSLCCLLLQTIIFYCYYDYQLKGFVGGGLLSKLLLERQELYSYISPLQIHRLLEQQLLVIDYSSHSSCRNHHRDTRKNRLLNNQVIANLTMLSCTSSCKLKSSHVNCTVKLINDQSIRIQLPSCHLTIVVLTVTQL